MDKNIKQAIAASATIFIILVAYYGTYLPMRKSMVFIETMGMAGKFNKVADFEEAISVPLDYPSPVGQRELVRNIANTINGIIRNVSDPEVVKELVNYVEGYYKPIIARDRGMSFGQDVYILGVLNEIAYIKTNEPEYLQAAEGYFEKEQKLGPKRPQGLYGLLDVYRMGGKIDEFKAVADQVLQQWPNDSRSKGLIEQFLKMNSSASGK